MNENLAKEVAEMIVHKWNPQTHDLDSEQVYEGLVAKGVAVPEKDMHEILDTFKNAGLIGGPGYMNSDAVKEHGAMVITSVNIGLLKQVEF
jgi:hypothetical protein